MLFNHRSYSTEDPFVATMTRRSEVNRTLVRSEGKLPMGYCPCLLHLACTLTPETEGRSLTASRRIGPPRAHCLHYPGGRIMSAFHSAKTWRFAMPAGGKAAAWARREARLRLVEDGVTRRRFLGVSAGTTGLLLGGSAWSTALAATCEPRPIPHTLDPDGPGALPPSTSCFRASLIRRTPIRQRSPTSTGISATPSSTARARGPI